MSIQVHVESDHCVTGHRPVCVLILLHVVVCVRNYGCLLLRKDIRDIPSYFIEALDTLSLFNHAHIYNVHAYMYIIHVLYMCSRFTRIYMYMYMLDSIYMYNYTVHSVY